MFAKLKEKIQKEGGNVSEGEKSLAPIPFPGHASPRRVSLANSPAQSPLTKEKLDDSFSFSNDELSKSDFSGKDDVFAALQKRTEQCKKLEAKNTEYNNALKDNAKKIEKLESYIEKQQDVLAKRSQELNEQYQASRIRLSDNYKQDLDQKEKEKQELLERLRETESMKEKYYKKEEEKEEMQQFTTQEMGKLKHMLILKEEELSQCQREFQQKNKELPPLEAKVKSLEAEKLKLEEESAGHGKIVSALTKERMTIEESLTDVKSQLSEKSSAFSSLQAKHTELESTQQKLVHNSDIERHKLNQQVQEHKDHIEQLEDRLKLLQKREQDKSLSGDDRLVAVEKERDGLEKKVAETREQLTQIKSSWSEKISHLEDQITHLNRKMAEDSEELAEAKQYTETVKEKLQKQIDGLKEKLKSSEKQVQEHVELISRKEARFKKERLELETEVSKMKLEKVDLDTQLRAKLASVESELMTLELSKSQEKSELQDAINKHEKTLLDYKGKLGKSEDCVKILEEKLGKSEADCSDLNTANKSLNEELSTKDKQLTETKTRVQALQEEVILTQEKLDKAVHSSKSKTSELQEISKDKDGFMLRNAELSQQLTTLQQTTQDEKYTLETELKARTESENELRIKCEELEARVREMTELQTGHTASYEQVLHLQDTVSTLEEQLAEKNKALKKQEQRLNDLKKTLQRELKVQSLPNDDAGDPKVIALTPPLPRKNSVTQNAHNEHVSRTRRVSPHERSPLPKEPVMDSVDGINDTIGTQDFFVGDSSQGHRSNSDRNSYSVPYSNATISVNEKHGISFHHGAYSSHGRSGHSRTVSSREFQTQHLEKDINFQYLKHVVMKFMLSREHESCPFHEFSPETQADVITAFNNTSRYLDDILNMDNPYFDAMAIQLIKAVSLLLRFTPDEQKLIRDTLEWKMSWFGGSQPPAVLKGQTNKIIPPSW